MGSHMKFEMLAGQQMRGRGSHRFQLPFNPASRGKSEHEYAWGIQSLTFSSSVTSSSDLEQTSGIAPLNLSHLIFG